MSDHPTANQLLLWATAASGGDTTYWMRLETWVSLRPVPAVSEDMAEQAVSTLSAHNWVVEHRAITGKVIDFALTAAGVREAQRRLVAVASRRQRLAYAENAILTWVLDTARPNRPVALIDFLDSPTSVFYSRHRRRCLQPEMGCVKDAAIQLGEIAIGAAVGVVR